MKLNIGYFYPHDLNLYGDNGNVEILSQRASQRNIPVEIFHITPQLPMTAEFLSDINLIFMGGGPDSSQKHIFEDFIHNKGPFIKSYIESGGVGLYICGSYQLLGNFYQPAEGEKIPGLGAFDLYTQHFGNHKPRCIGNVVCQLNKKILNDPIFKSVNSHNLSTLVGFENHGGRTYLANKSQALATPIKGHGNNSEDKTEGFHYKNSFGTYFHGPILSRNPHFADYLIAQALQTADLSPLDDSLVYQAHNISLQYK